MKKYLTFYNVLFAVIFVFSLAGLFASFALSNEKIAILEDKAANVNHVSVCAVNSVISCVSVVDSWQAELLGFPNTFIGIAGYTVTLTIAGLFLVSQQKNKWISLLALLGTFGSFVFSYWLLSQSVYSIGFLCPFCILSCFSATNIFFAFLILNLKDNNFNFRDSLNTKINTFIAKGWYLPLIVLWYALIFLLIYARFQESLFG